MSSDKPTVIAYWDNPDKTILIYDFAATWTWADFYSTKAKADAMLDSVTHDVAVIFSGPPSVRLPEDFLNNVVKINRGRHQRVTTAVIVISNAFVRAMFNTISRLYSGEFKRVTFVNSLEEARIVAVGRK